MSDRPTNETTPAVSAQTAPNLADEKRAPATREGAELVGGVTLAITPEDARAHLTYWIGVPYWGKGFATEAAREIVRYAFEELGLHRLYAAHFGSNPASGKVMRKIGMSYEGTFREHHKKWGEYEDRVEYGLLARAIGVERRRIYPLRG